MNVSVKQLVSTHLSRLLANRCRSYARQLTTSHVQPLNKRRLTRKTKTEDFNDFDHKLCDTFGTLGKNDHRFKRLAAEELSDDEDNYDVLEIKRSPKMSEIGYKIKLRQLLCPRVKRPINLAEALQLYNKMVSDDRIPPDKPTYTLMITGCARVGYTEKAFEFFEELLKYEFRPSKQCITSLFNACAESPFKELGLEKARYLREWMLFEGFEPNTHNYHSMIKAFGKLGEVETAFQLIKEMIKKGHTLDDYTFSMLMMTCISNKESGLFGAIKVIRQFLSKGMSMPLNIFNLLLRTVRDCGIGSEDNLNLLINNHRIPTKAISPPNKTKSLEKLPEKFSVSSNEHSLVSTTLNLLIDRSLSSDVIKIDFNALSKPHNRLMLLGGIDGFFKMMSDFGVNPDIKSLTLLVEIIDFNEISEKHILEMIDKFKIKADTDFFNILIKRICFQKGLLIGKQILSEMAARNLQPNIMTFGVLSLGCNRLTFGRQLLKDMEKLNIHPNIKIMGALMKNAFISNDISYINFLIDYMKDNDINPDQRIVEQLEAIKIKFQKIISRFERNNDIDIPERYKSQKFRENFARFKQKYSQWLESVTLEEKDHPWNQFQFQELPNKKGMHSFVRFMKKKIQKRRSISDEVIDEFEEEELYND